MGGISKSIRLVMPNLRLQTQFIRRLFGALRSCFCGCLAEKREGYTRHEICSIDAGAARRRPALTRSALLRKTREAVYGATV